MSHNISQCLTMNQNDCWPPLLLPLLPSCLCSSLCHKKEAGPLQLSLFHLPESLRDKRSAYCPKIEFYPKISEVYIPECFMDFCAFTSTFWFVSLQDTVSYPRYCTSLTYPPAHLILSASWCFIPFPGPIHNCPTNWDPNSNPLTNHHLECKDILQGQLSESETPDFHHFLHKPQHPAATIVESSTFRALPCQLPLLPFPFPLSQSQLQPQTHSHYSIFHCISISIHAWEIRMIKVNSGLKGSTQGTQDHLGPYDSISIMTDHTCWRVWWKSMPSLWWGKDVAFSAIPQFWLSQSSTNIFVAIVAWLFGVSALLLDLAASHPRICQNS